MALRDIFKRQKTEKTEGKTGEKPAASAVKESSGETKSLKGKRVNSAWRVLKTAHITEKATDLAGKNQYIFNVYLRANKNEIKSAVENIYGIDVVSVNVVNIPSKKRRVGKIYGWKSGYKKAIVKIKEGQKIELMPR
jgi:large subunit ribosomal protein L23